MLAFKISLKSFTYLSMKLAENISELLHKK